MSQPPSSAKASGVSLSARRRLILFRVGASLLGLAIALILLEVAARLFLWRYGEFIDRLHTTLAREYGGELTLRDIVKPAADERVVFELIPGAWGTFVCQPLRINSHGFRDVERTVAKTSGTLRIAVLGDSVAFGWGVPEEDRFSNVLEQLLCADRPTSPPQVEVLNFAVPGYNTVMEEALLRTKVVAFQPDVIVVHLVGNDDEVPNFIRLEPQIWAWDRSFLAEAIRDRLVGRRLGDTARLLIGGLAQAGGRGHGEGISGYRPELVPPRYRFLVGPENMLAAFDGIGQLCRERRINAVCLLHYELADLKRGLNGEDVSNSLWAWGKDVERRGFCIVDPLPVIVNYGRTRKLESEAFILRRQDIHPNPLAHRLIAEVLYQALQQNRDKASTTSSSFLAHNLLLQLVNHCGRAYALRSLAGKMN